MKTQDDHVRCNVCNCILTDDNWLSGNRRHNRKRCKDCDNKRSKLNHANHTFEQRLRQKINDTLRTHRQRGIEVIGSASEYMHTYTGECVYCSIEFDIFDSNPRRRGSIDRINNEAIMTPDNIQWLCYECNAGKQEMTHDEYITKIKLIAKRWS